MADKPVRDWVYLAIIGLQLTGMLGTPSAPIHRILQAKPPY